MKALRIIISKFVAIKQERTTMDLGGCYYEDEWYYFFKRTPEDTIMWLSHTPIGEHLFTFDGVKIYIFFADYPHHLTKEEVEIFDKENPYMANLFKERKIFFGFKRPAE